MKKYLTLIGLAVCMLALAGCGKGKLLKGGETVQLRIVDGADTGNLVLAGENAGDVYTLSVGEIPVYLDGEEAGASALEDGMMAEVAYDGGIEETYPARFSNVTSISVSSLGTKKNPTGTYYDLCGLYLQVLNDLWEKDGGLISGSTYVSVDLSQAPGELTEGEKSAIAWIFTGEHGTECLTLTYEELIEQGYLTEVTYGDEAEDAPKLYEWMDGILFSITAGEGEYSFPVVNFNAGMWRSPLGAYYLIGCESVWPEKGSWSSYTAGAEAIS